MSISRSGWWGSAVMVLAIAAGVVVVARARNRDIAFTQRVFASLAAGEPSVRRQIAWPRLRAVDIDVGDEYRRLGSPKEQADYEQAFVDRFAYGFREAKGRVDHFSRWRIARREGGENVVAADELASGKTLLFRVSHRGGPQLEAIQWQ